MIFSFPRWAELRASDSPTMEWVRQMFVEHTSLELLPEIDDTYGVVFRDLNQDSYPDLYLVRFRNLNRLFINKNGRGLEDLTIQSGLGGNLMPLGKHNLELGAGAADYDNDGRVDVLIVGWGVTTRLFRQQKFPIFADVTDEAGFIGPIDGNAGIWSDVDRDGDLDLFISDEHHPNHLFIQQTSGKFAEKAPEWGVYLPTITQGAAFADVDGDGYPDLYICNWFSEDVFYRNRDGKYFQPMRLPIPHLQDSLKSNGVSFGDVDNDGDLDLLVTDRDGHTALYRNDISPGDTAWHFQDVTREMALHNPYPAYGSVIADLNNDGWQDIFFTNIGPNQLFLNREGQRFELVYQEPLEFVSFKKHYSTGTAVADFDRDGDLDLFVANKDSHSVLYLNPLTGASSLRLLVEGVQSNRDGIGTRIWLFEEQGTDTAGKLIGYREISGGGGYLSFSEPIAHFGVQAGKIYQARVIFPSGNEQVLHNLTPGKLYRVEESSQLTKAAWRTYHFLKRSLQSRNFWINLILFLIIISTLGGYSTWAMKRYTWGGQQVTLFLMVVILFLYLDFWIFTGWTLTGRFFTQIVLLAIILLVTTVFSEKIRQLNLKRFGYRKFLRELSQQIILIKNNSELFRQLAQSIQENLPIRFCAVCVPENQHLKLEALAGEEPVWLNNVALKPEWEQFIRPATYFKGEEIQQVFINLPPQSVQMVLPIARQEKIHAWLIIGSPRNDQKLDTEDSEILQILANQAAIAIENNIFIEETKALIKKVTEAETREKYVRELEEKNQTLQKLYRELQETQTQLIQSEKMASLGQLVAGIAHELNNPISFIYANMKELQNYIQAIRVVLDTITEYAESPRLQNQLQETLARLKEEHDLMFIKSDIDKLIHESLEGSERVKQVVQNLRNFSRLDEAEFKEVNLHEGLESTLLLLNNEIKNRITVHKNYGELPLVWCHPGQINQVFMNLLLNAIQAIPDKGNIWIETGQNQDQVVIRIRDDGPGIPPDILPKIFDPFFTTKPVGKGTGLGLSISYGIIREHGGQITVESEPGKGTTFTITLPIHPRKGKSGGVKK